MFKFLFIYLIIIISIFHYNASFTVKLIRTEYKSNKSEYMEFNAFVKKFNRTTNVGELEATVFKEFPTNMMYNVKLYAAYSNRYQLLPVQIRRNLCIFFQYEYKFIETRLNGKYPIKCPILPGKYYVKDFLPDTSKFPYPPWDAQEYRLYGELQLDNKIIASAAVYIYVSKNDDII